MSEVTIAWGVLGVMYIVGAPLLIKSASITYKKAFLLSLVAVLATVAIIAVCALFVWALGTVVGSFL